MQKEINKNMTAKQAFIYSAERAGINVQYYLDTHDNSFLTQATMYIRAANNLIKEMELESCK